MNKYILHYEILVGILGSMFSMIYAFELGLLQIPLSGWGILLPILSGGCFGHGLFTLIHGITYAQDKVRILEIEQKN